MVVETTIGMEGELQPSGFRDVSRSPPWPQVAHPSWPGGTYSSSSAAANLAYFGLQDVIGVPIAGASAGGQSGAPLES